VGWKLDRSFDELNIMFMLSENQCGMETNEVHKDNDT